MCDRYLKPGMELAICSKPACGIGCLEHEHVLTAPCQVGGADQSVVSCPNDDRIEAIQMTTILVICQSVSTLVAAMHRFLRAYTLWQCQ